MSIIDSSAVESICKRIQQEAELSITDILEKARMSAQNTLQAKRTQAESDAQAVLQDAAEKASGIRRQILSIAKVEKKRSISKHQEEIIKRLVSSACDKIRARCQKDTSYKQKLLRYLLFEALVVIASPKVVIYTNPEDAPVFTKEFIKDCEKEAAAELGFDVNASITASKAAGDIGIIAVSSDNAVGFDNTLNARVLRADEDIRLSVGKELFGEI